MVPIARLLPSRKEPLAVRVTRKFQQLKASIEAVGLIEPLSVAAPDKAGLYVLLDGHLRLIVAQMLEWPEIAVLVASDDEGYTYNSRINRLSTIQETHMLRRAVERGVSAQRLAQALSVDISQIHKKITLLDGLCPEAIEMLRDMVFTTGVGSALKKMKPNRQIECVELMVSANNFTQSYAEALLVATPAAMLIDDQKTFKRIGVGKDQMLKMENEMASLQRQYKLVEQTYGHDVLNLVLAKGYLNKILANEAISSYLQRHYPELLDEFRAIADLEALEV
jgi:ParB-like chromosome segregation protein Spo0J